MTQKNKITPHQTTILRRINRQFSIVPKNQKVEAVLHLPVNYTESGPTGAIQTRTFNRHLIIENTGNEFIAETFIHAQFKMRHWRKWRTIRKDFLRFSSDNFHKLIEKVQTETLGGLK